MATKKMLTLPSQKLVLPTQLPWDVTQKRMIGNPTFTPDWKQITGGSGVTYSLKDMWWQDTPYTTTEVAGVKGWPTSTPPPTESLDSILANNRSAQGSSTPTSNARGATNVSTYSIPNAKLLAQSGWQSDSLPWAINPEDRIPWVYYPTPLPTPNTPTPTNPVTKISLQKAVPIAPDIAQIQQMDINNLNDTIDKLQIKQSKEQLSDEELLTLRRATRQLQQSMTPQSLTWWLDEMIAKKETNIIETTNKLDKQNEQELAQFKQSQEAYKQSEIQAIEQADEEQKKTLWYILWAQGAGTSSFWAEQINKITQNSLQKKQVLAQAVQAKIDLYGSQLRKDSQETIQTLQTNLDNLYMKAAEFDVENIKELNAFNKEQWANKIKEIDSMIAYAQQQQKLALPLTEAEKQQANAFAANLYDNEGNFDDKTFELLQKINPKLAMEAVLQGWSIQKERMSNDLAMKWLDADIKRAQLNKLLNPAKEYEYIKDADWNTVAIDKENPNVQIKISGDTSWLGDMRHLASQFPWQARAKNNNPAGITWNSNFDNMSWTAKLLAEAGIPFSKGTARPANEGGNYVTFPTMADWLAAQRILMTQTYGNNTVGNMLAKWVWTGEWPSYAKQVAGMAGVDINAIVNQLSDSQLQTLQMAKIQKESPWLAKILQQQSKTDKKLTPEKQTAIQDALTAIEQLESTPWKSGAVWWSFQKYLPWRIKPWEWQFIPWTDAATFEARFNNLRDQLTLPNLDKLKGAMSDKDIQFLRNTSAALSLDMSEAEFDKSLKQVKEKFQNMLWVQTQEQVKWWSIDDLRNDL